MTAVAPSSVPSVTSTTRDIITVDHADFHYGTKQALFDIDMRIAANQVTAFIGPSGCGKSTLLRCFNRMNDLVDGARVTRGRIMVDGLDLADITLDVTDLRKRVGMVFQRSNPFPRSIFENVAYGLRAAGVRDRTLIEQTVVESLKGAALWDETKDRLRESAFSLSGGQQQRLCIARALAVKPHIILMDEPCSALDPIATGRVEELIQQLGETFTIVIVTHNMEQARRVSDRTAFFYLGRLEELAATDKIFSNPESEVTANYITGRMG